MAGLNLRTGQRNQTNYVPNANRDLKLKAQEAGGFRSGYVGSTGDMVNPNDFLGSWSFVNQKQQEALESSLGLADRFKTNEAQRRMQIDAQQQASSERIAGIQSSDRVYRPNQNQYMDQFGVEMQRELYDRQQGRGYLYDRQVEQAKQQDADASYMSGLQKDIASRDYWKNGQNSYGGLAPLASGYVYDWSKVSPYGGGTVDIKYNEAYDTAKKETDQQVRLMREKAQLDEVARNQQSYQDNVARQNDTLQQQQLATQQANTQRFQALASMFGNLGQGMAVRYW